MTVRAAILAEIHEDGEPRTCTVCGETVIVYLIPYVPCAPWDYRCGVCQTKAQPDDD